VKYLVFLRYTSNNEYTDIDIDDYKEQDI